MKKLPSAALLAMVALAGCAAQQDFRDGRRLIESGDSQHGLPKLEEAARLAPDNLEYRVYYFKQRDLAVQQLITRGDNARKQGDEGAAESAYREAAGLDPGGEQATSALASLQFDQQYRTLIAEGRAALDAGHPDDAKAKAHLALGLDPARAEAQDLLKLIDKTSGNFPTRLENALDRPITMEFRDTDLRSVFELISHNTGVNFLFDKDVKSDLRTTIYVHETSIPDVIRFILGTNQLGQKILNDNTILIYPNTPAKASEYQDLITKSFYLAHADVKQTAAMIKTLVKTKDIFVDEKLRLLVMRDRPEAIRMAEKLVANQDIAPPEVMLDVQVLEVSKNVLTDLGIRYPSQLSASLAGTGSSATTGGVLTLQDWINRDAGLVRLTVTDPLVILNLQQQDTKTRTLANPRIRVKDGEKASIHVGDKVPVITTTLTATSFASQSVSYLDTGLKLEVEPTISLDREVSIKIGLEVSSILNQITTPSGTIAYQLGTRNADTVLDLKDGETQVLAGLISRDEQKTIDKIPGLGSIPLIGHLFSNHNDSDDRTEIVLLITPHIVRALARPELELTEFSSGTENVVGSEPLSLRPLSTPPPSSIAPVKAEGQSHPDVSVAVGSLTPTLAPAPISQTAAVIVPTPQLPHSGSDGRIILQAPAQANIGDEFTVAVRIASDNPTRSGTINMAFDQNQFKVVKVEPGAMLTQGDQQPAFQSHIEDDAGRLSISYSASADIKGEGDVAQVVFQVNRGHPGTTIIRVEPPKIVDASGQDVSISPPSPLVMSVGQ